MVTVSSPSRAQFQRFGTTTDAPQKGQPGALAVNLTDRKVWSFDPVGDPVLMGQLLGAHDPTRAYSAGDCAVAQDAVWRANVTVSPGAFNPAQWSPLVGDDVRLPGEPVASGVLHGGIVSVVSGNTVSFTSGAGILLDTSDPADPLSLTSDISGGFQWSAGNGVIASGGDAMRAIGMSALGNLVSIPMADLATRRRDRVILGYAIFDGSGNIARVLNTPRVVAQTPGDLGDLVESLGGAFIVQGGKLGAAGAMAVSMSEGRMFAPHARWRSAPGLPNMAALPAANPVVFDVIAANGALLASAQSAVPSTLYAGGTVPPGFSTIHYLFATPTGAHYWLQQGQTLYSSLTAAASAVQEDWAAYEAAFPTSNAVAVVGAVVVQRDAVNLAAGGRILPVLPGPRVNLRFQTGVGDLDFLPRSGSAAMAGPLDMAGNDVQNAIIDEGIF